MKRVLLYDNYDSFSYLIADKIKQAGAEVFVIANDIDYKDVFYPENFDAVVLSPGPERPENAGYLLDFINDYVNMIPMLGICLGHQALGVKFGLELTKAPKPMHGKISEIKKNSSSKLFKNLPNTFEVCRYHSLIVEGESVELNITAKTDDHIIMAFEHKHLPVFGVQFHPEAILTKFGREIIVNWLDTI